MEIVSRITTNNEIIKSYFGFKIMDNSLNIYFHTFTLEYKWLYSTSYNITIYDVNENVLFNCIADNQTKQTNTTRSRLGPSSLNEFFDEILHSKINVILLYEEFRALNELDNNMDLAIDSLSDMSFVDKVEEL